MRDGSVSDPPQRYADRREAGRRLAQGLHALARGGALVVGLPRGGVVVADEVAKALSLPLDVLIVRKLGMPGREELGFGAIAEGDVTILNAPLVESLGLRAEEIEDVARMEGVELARRVRAYRGNRPPADVRGRTVLLVDDGLATGGTARAAVAALRAQGAARVVLAVPVGPPDLLAALEEVADEVVCPLRPPEFRAVGLWYDDFSPTTDEEVRTVLARTSARLLERDVTIDLGPVQLAGRMTAPALARGVVVFAHGSGSGRDSPRNARTARSLSDAGFATLLCDLLTDEEAQVDERTREYRFDVRMLGDRVRGVVDWLAQRPETARLPVGLYGASTGAAAALLAAAEIPARVAAVVSRGGRPDLAAGALPHVRAPTLFVVGEADPEVLALNRQARAALAGPSEIAIVPSAGHLFEEPGALDEVARLAAGWFARHLGGRTAVAPAG
ncbi:MAG TPA: alpha/beta family hydrolase [Candidatus Thermoplasmatota archaeon]|nr:alpha/beta family hydrolase [Candidatus Thermoplasmatota archaeon]